MIKDSEKDWLGIVKNQFEHPAIVLWRAVELRHIEKELSDISLHEPILDLGCAEGKIANLLFKGKTIFGLDNCWELLSQNNKLKLYKALTLADACHMPYKDRVFASVFSNCVIEHIRDVESVLTEVGRVLKDKGIFLFTVPSHKFADFLFFSTVFEKLRLNGLSCWYKLKRNQLLNHFHCYDHFRWKEILRKKGFNLLNYDYYMTKEATFIWDFLAFLVLILRYAWPLNYFLPKINKCLGNFLNKYYNMESTIGSGLMLIAQKGD